VILIGEVRCPGFYIAFKVAVPVRIKGQTEFGFQFRGQLHGKGAAAGLGESAYRKISN
jgi:hypothetical protein